MKQKLIIAGLLLVAGFIIGRWAIPSPEPEVKYIELPPVRDSLSGDDLRPISETVRDSVIYITRYKEVQVPINPGAPDTVIRYVTVVDTQASMKATAADWNTERKYEATLFDTPELGKFDYIATVQFNKIQNFSYNYAPKQRMETTVKSVPAFTPFVRASYTTFDHVTIGGGTYIKNIGIDGFYIRDIRNGTEGLGIGLSLKF